MTGAGCGVMRWAVRAAGIFDSVRGGSLGAGSGRGRFTGVSSGDGLTPVAADVRPRRGDGLAGRKAAGYARRDGHGGGRFIGAGGGDGLTSVAAEVRSRRGDGLTIDRAVGYSQRQCRRGGLFTDVSRGDGLAIDKAVGYSQRQCRRGGLFTDVSRGEGLTIDKAVGYSQRGFTLIEILLATTLLALGLALAFATLRASTATVERGEAIAARSERMRAVDGFLRRRLASAAPIAFAIDEDSGRMVRFIGEPERIRFVADLPNYLGRGGPHLHDLAVLDAGDGARLAVSFAMVASGTTIEDRQARPPETLVPDLAQARFRYRGLGEDGLLGEWTDSWEQVDTLPLQVSVELASRSGGSWPPLVVMLPQRMGGVVP